MTEIDRAPGREPEDLFEHLRDRATPELDSPRLWRRIEARLTPRTTGLRRRLFGVPAAPSALRLAVAIATVAVVALVVWAVVAPMQAPDAGFVPLTAGEPETPEATVAPPGDASVELDVRLVRGFDGSPPEDVRSARALGLGGADALADVRARIGTLLPYADFGVVGAWRGRVAAGDRLDAELSGLYRLVARSTDTGNGSVVRLDGAELAGAAGTPVSGDLALEPGRLYILGVVTPGGDDPELVLLIRARVSGQEGR